jgi:hypothetical protein
MLKLNLFITISSAVLLLSVSANAQNVPTSLIEVYGKDGFTIQNSKDSDQLTMAGSWAQGANMPSARYYAGSVMYTRSDTSWLYVFGGDTTGTGVATSTCLKYNLETDKWEYIAPLPEPMRVNTAAKLGDKLYSMGGFNAPFPSPAISSFYEYDVNTNTWMQLSDLPDPLFFAGAEGFEDSLIYIFGGIQDNASDADLWRVNVVLFNRVDNSFREATPLPNATASFGHARIGATFYITAGLKSPTELWDDHMEGKVDPVIKSNITWTFKANYQLSIYAGYNYPVENNEEHCMLGGSTTTGFTPITEGFRYNIVQNNFMMKQPLPINLMGSSGGHTKFLERAPEGVIIQSVVLAGGITTGPALTNQTWILTDTVNVSDISEITSTIPKEYSLSQNYPNPFNPTTNIEYSIPEASFVQLKVYDILGNEVATLVNEEQSAGNYRADFSGANLSSGLYITKLQAGDYTKTIKMTLMK